MFLEAFFILLGFTALAFGSQLLLTGTLSLAQRLKIDPTIMALTVVALATSSPELITNLFAIYKGSSEVALGNIVGSNTFNILIVVGASALVLPQMITKKIRTFELPFLLFSSFVVLALAYDLKVSALDGAVFLILLVVFLLISFYREKSSSSLEDDTLKEMLKSSKHDTVYILGGTVLIFFGAEWTIEYSLRLGEALGISKRILGVFVVSVGTSLPELSTSLMASYKKMHNIVIPSVIGSNIFNVFFVLGLSSVFQTVEGDTSLLHRDIPYMILSSALLLVFLFSGKAISRPVGFLFLFLYLAYIPFSSGLSFSL